MIERWLLICLINVVWTEVGTYTTYFIYLLSNVVSRYIFITIIDCNKCKNKKIYHLISCFISFLKRRFTNCVQQKNEFGQHILHTFAFFSRAIGQYILYGYRYYNCLLWNCIYYNSYNVQTSLGIYSLT